MFLDPPAQVLVGTGGFFSRERPQPLKPLSDNKKRKRAMRTQPLHLYRINRKRERETSGSGPRTYYIDSPGPIPEALIG